MGLDLDKAGASIIEVGGKRNLIEFCRIARSFNIPFGVVYDEDSLDIKSKKEEGNYNAELDDFGVDGNRSWRFTKTYEDELKTAVGGDAEYQRLCQKYSNTGKPTRARLIAADPTTAVPKKVNDILTWLSGNKESAQ